MPPARETLSGDRACTHCFHPLLGRAIEREPSTGLLFVRCGECGAATAMMEYPSATPWVRRMKTVVATGLVATFLLLLLTITGLAGGFALFAATLGADATATPLHAAYAQTNAVDAAVEDMGYWSIADEAWLDTDAGSRAIDRSRTAPIVLMSFAAPLASGCLLLVPPALVFGGIAIRRGALARALLATIPVLIGCAVILTPTSYLHARPAIAASWRDVAMELNFAAFAYTATGVLALVAALSAVLAPPILAATFRAILPPRDRYLVAWVWEWRGKPIPRDN